jgi:magnesium chelatase subunit D
MDVLLDAAAMGVNYVEREGISFRHPARFILIGTMNPEEGDLRPQLLDRFGLCAEVGRVDDPRMRAEVVRRRIAFETDPVAFHEHWKESEEAERQRILAAKEILAQVRLSESMLQLIARMAIEAQVDGLRPDIVMHKTATALAAYAGRMEVEEEDVREAAELALRHRRKTSPGKPPPSHEPSPLPSPSGRGLGEGKPPQGNSPPQSSVKGEGQVSEEKAGEPGKERRFEAGAPFPVRQLFFRLARSSPWVEKGRRTVGASQGHEGRYVRSSLPHGKIHSLALDATLRAAAPYQLRRKRDGATTLQLRPWDLREKIREKKIGNLILFLVDASGSMGAWRRMVAVKGAILSLLKDAYQKRDRVGLVSFRGEGAELLLPPTGNFQKAEAGLRALPTGGRTPLAHGLKLALQMFQRASYQERPLFLVLVSDGRANVSLANGDPMAEARGIAREIGKRGVPSLVLDAEAGFFRLGFARELAHAMSGVYLMLEQLEGGQVAKVVRTMVAMRRQKRS